jgi:hypothetical protein
MYVCMYHVYNVCMRACMCVCVCVQYTKHRLGKGTSLGAIRKLREATVGSVMSFPLPVRLSTRKKLGSHWTDIHEI